ncbi:topless-related protein 4-like protein isoform X1 [Tanacetum coccineum]
MGDQCLGVRVFFILSVKRISAVCEWRKKLEAAYPGDGGERYGYDNDRLQWLLFHHSRSFMQPQYVDHMKSLPRLLPPAAIVEPTKDDNTEAKKSQATKHDGYSALPKSAAASDNIRYFICKLIRYRIQINKRQNTEVVNTICRIKIGREIEENAVIMGLTDGGVIVLELQESEGKWGTSPPAKNGAGPSSITVGATSTNNLKGSNRL